MAANLTIKYYLAEEKYRRAQTSEERLNCLEGMLQVIPKHKGTDHLQAAIRWRIKEARAEVQAERDAPKSGRTFRIPRQGAGTVVVIGAPNSGKSRIIAELTNAQPEVAEYPFTTREPFPAMMSCQDVLIQLVDTPPISQMPIEPYVVNYVRTADLVVLAFDGSSDDAPDDTLNIVQQLEARKTLLDQTTGYAEDDFSKLRVQTLLAATQADDQDAVVRISLFRESMPRDIPVVQVELQSRDSCDSLRDVIYESLGLIRVYTKAPGKAAVYEVPFAIPAGSTVETLAERVHHDFVERLKFAKVWGAGGHDGQQVGRDHVLLEGDMVELHV
ncbi:MAG: 50S ribosome-binding GTPase [Planctomycetota bacterium]|nr:50S ribosome-binding GTPase [Planctomycetota bacterium]